MLRLAMLFLVVALVAAVFGFGGIVEVATDFAFILFFVFLTLFILSAIVGVIRRPDAGPPT